MTLVEFLFQPDETGINYLKNTDRRDVCFNLFGVE